MSSNWIVFTPDHYYEASPGAERFIGWRAGDRLLPARALAAQYRRLDKVGTALAGAG